MSLKHHRRHWRALSHSETRRWPRVPDTAPCLRSSPHRAPMSLPHRSQAQPLRTPRYRLLDACAAHRPRARCLRRRRAPHIWPCCDSPIAPAMASPVPLGSSAWPRLAPRGGASTPVVRRKRDVAIRNRRIGQRRGSVAPPGIRWLVPPRGPSAPMRRRYEGFDAR